jgi:2-polyprenyl-6-methoxyphenol hydroxylase-like FAD-dependent oxidoreductase
MLPSRPPTETEEYYIFGTHSICSSVQRESLRVRGSDIVIVGGGLSGTLAAVLLGRAAHDVALIDRHDEYPPEFRAEQLLGSQVDALRRLGVFDALVAGVPRIDHAIAARRGR